MASKEKYCSKSDRGAVKISVIIPRVVMTQVECNRRAVSGLRRKTKAPSAGGMRSHSTQLRLFTSSTRHRVFDARRGHFDPAKASCLRDKFHWGSVLLLQVNSTGDALEAARNGPDSLNELALVNGARERTRRSELSSGKKSPEPFLPRFAEISAALSWAQQVTVSSPIDVLTPSMDYVSSLCCLLAFVLYYNTLDAGFVYDDRRAILSNPDLLPKTPWARLLENDFWGTPLSDSGSHGSYRPLCVLTFRLNYLLGGFQPWGYHLVNVLLHCLATALLVKLARQVLPKSKSSVGPAITGLIFATHPIHTEAVAGVVGRADLAACNFYLLSFLAYVTHTKHRDSFCCYGGNKEDNMKQLRTLKYQKFVYSLQKNVTSCNWPKRLGVSEACNKNVVFRMHLKEKNEACCLKSRVRQWMYLGLCILLALAAMLSKETGITVLGMCMIYDFIYCPSLKKRQWRSLLVLGAASVILLAIRLQSRVPQFSTADNPTAREPKLLTRLLTFIYLPVFNFWLLLVPNTLSFDWGMDAIPRITTLGDSRNIVTFCFYSLLFLLVKKSVSSMRSPPKTCRCCHLDLSDVHTVNCRNTNNNNTAHSTCVCLSKRSTSNSCCVILLALAFLTLPFLPATNLLFYVGFVVAERVLYLPSAGLCLMVGLGGAALYRKYRTPFTVGFIGVLLTFSAKTVLRNKDWTNEEALYRAAVNVNPPKAFGNLGSVLSSQGRITEAEWAFRKALQFRPNMADVHYNLGILLQARQQLGEAIESYQRAIHFRPSLALAYVNLGAALISAGRCQEAVSVLRQGSRLDGTGLRDRREHETARVSALLQLGALYSEQGRLQRALAAYREAAYSLPEHYPPQSVFNVLGETLARLQQDEEAERWYQAALNAQPDHVPAHITYGKLLAKNVSRTAEAEQWFRKAQRLAPQEPSVYHHYGEFLASRRRYKEASVMYEKAAELRPHDYELAVAAATAMRQAGRHQEAERWYRTAVDLKPSVSRLNNFIIGKLSMHLCELLFGFDRARRSKRLD
ncbi:Transmembrane and TPR repeat-containing protein CG31690-like Protein [Tribolium castaneum]|uniref:dolichyl-phosphate-mannose--protein mannosyltransferase n=1 Tax=Tribolium castaneum TaxID=7070 RepID=A0A139WIW0_TRICA|nr:Transmembrane and TPR repeat-containing protein CG31690-like Protein [Tribolium castaneum]